MRKCSCSKQGIRCFTFSKEGGSELELWCTIVSFLKYTNQLLVNLIVKNVMLQGKLINRIISMCFKMTTPWKILFWKHLNLYDSKCDCWSSYKSQVSFYQETRTMTQRNPYTLNTCVSQITPLLWKPEIKFRSSKDGLITVRF